MVGIAQYRLPTRNQRLIVHPRIRPKNRPAQSLLAAGGTAGTPKHPSPSLLEVNAVSVTASDTLLLPPTSFHTTPGQIVALRGANGSGKTTLLRTMAGRIRPTTGTVHISGQTVNERDPTFRRRVAVMIGLPPMAPDLTVFDHVALVSSTWQASTASADAASVDAASHRVLYEFELTALRSRYPHELSSGQTQLFGLALVFVRPFDVLLLDEPEQRLDPSRIELLAQAMLASRAAGATIVAATHSSSLADRTADLTITLKVRA